MEGIAGIYGLADEALVRKMLRKLKHRGPGVTDVHIDDELTLGACGPALRTGDKILALAERDGVVVGSDSYLFNRRALIKGFLFESVEGASDAQLLLALYRLLGTRMFGYLDGAFAVAISDNGKLILARDRYGLKPLYITGGRNVGSFSSELKSQVIANPSFTPFPPGKMFITGKGYRPINLRTPLGRPENRKGRSSEVVRSLIVESVLQCMDDSSAFNVLLSGGTDSSVVAAAATEVASSLNTVCVGVEESQDIEMARKVSEYLGTNHKERVYDLDEMIGVLDRVIYSAESFDYPLVRSCIPNYLAVHAFEDKHRVTLCGEGGDEVFAGYDYMRSIKGDRGLRSERMRLLQDGWLTGFQRVDRMTASASLDGRMPIMSASVIEYGLTLKRKDLFGPRIEQNKLALRKAFESLLPKEAIWRRKQRFSDGAGSMHALVRIADMLISSREFKKERKALPRGRIRNKEELLYYRHFAKHFNSESALAAVGLTPRP